MWSRIHLVPLLQAESDRDHVRRYLADQAREKELLGDNMKVYNSDRYFFFLSFSSFPPLEPILGGGGGFHTRGGESIERQMEKLN